MANKSDSNKGANKNSESKRAQQSQKPDEQGAKQGAKQHAKQSAPSKQPSKKAATTQQQPRKTKAAPTKPNQQKSGKAQPAAAKTKGLKSTPKANARSSTSARVARNAPPAGKAQTAPKPPKEKRKKREKKERQPITLRGVLEHVLPILSLALAFVAVVLLYQHIMPQGVKGADNQNQNQVIETSAPITDANAYVGVKDKWVPEGYFTTGNAELDEQVKQFCDALTQEGASVRTNAQNVYNTIAWSNIEWRNPNDKPAGPDWVIAAARHYFSTGNPALGIGGSGDEYEFSAVTCLCLRYFGYYDALAVPIVRGGSTDSSDDGALVIVTDENGKDCVCDPSLGANGFMLDRSLYNILVDNIGQDLTAVEARGLSVQKDTPDSLDDTSGNATGGTSTGTETGIDADTSISTGTSNNTGTGTGTGTSTSTGTGAGTGTGTGTSNETSTSNGTGTDTGTGTLFDSEEYSWTD